VSEIDICYMGAKQLARLLRARKLSAMRQFFGNDPLLVS